jgi:heat shock protein HtpX
MMRSLWWGRGRRDRDGGGNAGAALLVVAVVLAVLTPIIAQLIQLAVSRQREYLADASGALLTRFPPGLANALRKIAADKEALEVANKATASLYIANPLKDAPRAMDGLFDTHPPIAERIRRLEAM